VNLPPGQADFAGEDDQEPVPATTQTDWMTVLRQLRKAPPRVE
jgi:hypothetical protein